MILLRLVDTLFLVYMVMLFLRILSSWFPEFRDSQWVRFISFYTDPYLNLFRKIVPPIGMFDLSPIVAFFCLQLIELLVKALIQSIL